MTTLRRLLGLLAVLRVVVQGFQNVQPKLASSRSIQTSSSSQNRRFDGAAITTPVMAAQITMPPRKMSTSSSLHATTSPSSARTHDYTCDVLVLGSGPAARSIASLLGANGLQVVLADQNEERDWPPNYGVWQDEWQAIVDKYAGMGVTLDGGNQGQCVDRAWPVTDCYFGGSFDIPTENRMRLDRPYYRVDRFALRKSLMAGKYETVRANHQSKAMGVNMYEPAGSLLHDSEGSTTVLEKANGEKLTVRSKLIVDCTGHETKLVLRETRDTRPKPGFQIAYGMLVDVDEASFRKDKTQIGPYDVDAMTLFDYRTDHYDSAESGVQEKVESAPTFMYAMPLKDNQIFFEETSLVARPAISFQECKDRCYDRLKHLGITVTKVYEEEFCYIPMGGALPAKDQRVIGLGGAAAMVHPSTGYHLCRCMMGASDMASVILRELKQSSVPNLDRVAALSYDALWTPDNIRQRNFAVFGGEYLMKQDVVGLRGFFDGFFRLPTPLWAGFLAGWPGLPNNDKHETWFARLWFGLSFVSKLPLPVAWSMLVSIITYSISKGLALPQSVTPFLGQPASYVSEPNMDFIGDVAAKTEARRMLSESKVEEDVPVAFESSIESVSSSTSPTSKAGFREAEDAVAVKASPKDEDEEEEEILIEIA